MDFIYWMSFAVYQTTFALFGAHRFGFDAAKTGYFLSAFGVLGVIVQGGLVGPIVKRLGERRTLTLGLLLAAIGWGGSAFTYSLPVFVLLLVPGAMGIGLCNATLSALISHAAAPGEQGRVQGAAGALESLGRAAGPVWGNGALQHFGEGSAYAAAAMLLVGAATIIGRYTPGRSEGRRRRQLPTANFQFPRKAWAVVKLGSWELSWKLSSAFHRRELLLEPRYQRIELFDDRADRVGRAQVDAGFLQLLHRVIVPA